MSIGETLAAARRRAGLTVTQVSQRTRIRETLIMDIERDDYSACGGDFYTRGHIRSIAKAVGADSVPLIEEYDAARRERDAITETDIFPPPPPVPPDRRGTSDPHAGQDWRFLPGGRDGGVAPGQPDQRDLPGPRERQGPKPHPGVPGRQEAPGWQRSPAWPGPAGATGRMTGRRRPNWSVALGMGLALVVALGVLGYQLLPGSRPSRAVVPSSRGHPAARHSATAGPLPTRGSPAAPHTHTVVVHLTAIRGCSVEFTTPGGGYLSRSRVPAGVSESWTFRQAVDMRLCNPARVRLTVDGMDPVPGGPVTHPITLHLSPGHRATVSFPPPSAVPTGSLTPASASAIGPGGGQGDNPQLAPLAIDGNPATAWHTDWYTSARFGNLYPGTGLLLDMGRTVTITGTEITLGSTPGADLQFRVGGTPSLAGLPAVAQAVNAAGVVRLHLAAPAHGRYVLIWFTNLPPDATGTFQASVYQVTLQGRA